MTTPYTAAELAEFKDLIDTKLAEAQRELAELKTALANKEEWEGLSQQETTQLMQRQSKFINHLQAALHRIANRTYGICRVTGAPISKERLRVVPHATLAIVTRPVENKD